MRNLLFKGKRADNGDWVEGIGIYYPKSLKNTGECYLESAEDYSDKWIKVIPETVSEDIGVKDMVNNLIFENDLIETIDNRIKGIIKYGPYKQRGWPSSYECVNQGFYIDWIDDGVNCWNDWMRQDIYFWKDKIRVGGNIFDHPELLRK
ncbi:YopX family protein [Clostridium aminobutyricum]|uniref:YopX protein domain-containing protein n=1 Tax=Clostridium aminobutyricum TaxID=33953 RepID=A0A939IK68_CLOAM|nr:YopX family protein [Clostridium aminobutyricum]MBN7774328.1 hypothetical protein [Clostridium aminobutyricum]